MAHVSFDCVNFSIRDTPEFGVYCGQGDLKREFLCKLKLLTDICTCPLGCVGYQVKKS